MPPKRRISPHPCTTEQAISPPWADLPDGIREAWRGVSGAVLEVLKERLQEEDAEANEMPDLWIQGFRFAKSIILEEQAMLAEILKE